MGIKSNSCAKGADAPEPNFGGNIAIMDDELANVVVSNTDIEEPKRAQQKSTEQTNSLNLFYSSPDQKRDV